MTPPGDEIGAHMSIAGGLHHALDRGREVGCGAIQIFLKNQRQWAAKPLEADEVRMFRAARRRTGIRRAFAHSSYLINLASPDASAWAQAVSAFTDELERAEALELSCVVIHPGSHMGAGLETGLRRVIAALDQVLARTSGCRVKVALENTAGGGNSLGRTFAELATLIDGAARPERIGVCVDTCHLFAAGYDVRTEAGYGRAMAECEAAVGRRRVLAFHLNDAKAPLGSGLDRHEHIGRGFLGLAPFRFLLNDRRFARVPKVLETPKEPEPTADLRNLATLRRLRRRLGRRSRETSWSAGGLDADSAAEGGDGAERAAGRDRHADVLPEGDEEVVVADPVAARQLPPERHLGLFGVPGLHVAQPIRDPVHVGVHTDAGLAVAHRHDQVGRLPSHAVEGEELVDRVGHAAVESREQVPADPENDARLRTVEADRIDESLDLSGYQLQHGLRRRGHGEEALGGGTGRRVLRAQRQDAGDEDAERIAIALGDDRERGRVPARRAPPKPADDGTDRYFRSLMDSSSFLARGASFTVQSATIVGVVSLMTRCSSRRASA